MIIRKNLQSLHTHFMRGALGAAIVAGMVGCSTISGWMEPERVDYKSASKAPAKSLEIPPNLTQLQRDNRYAVPGSNNGTATASSYSEQRGTQPGANAAVVAVASNAEVRVERAGNQRWLVTKQSPEALWPQIRDFWQESGFLINIEMPEAGIMETDWAEKRLNVPQGMLRGFLAKTLDSAYDAGIRDKFRTRLERLPDGSTEIYVSHRGAEEVYTGNSGGNRGPESTVWVARASDPELEAQMLSQLMTRLGTEQARSRSMVANATPMQQRARLVQGESGAYVENSESFDRAWRRVGLALDRVGFTVEDRDRSQGLYFVRYVNQDEDAQDKAKKEKGFFSKLLSFGSSSKEDPKSAQRYRISVKDGGPGVSRIQVLNADGGVDNSPSAGKILALLNDQLK